jgi:hypothetical protein
MADNTNKIHELTPNPKNRGNKKDGVFFNLLSVTEKK